MFLVVTPKFMTHDLSLLVFSHRIMCSWKTVRWSIQEDFILLYLSFLFNLYEFITHHSCFAFFFTHRIMCKWKPVDLLERPSSCFVFTHNSHHSCFACFWLIECAADPKPSYRMACRTCFLSTWKPTLERPNIVLMLLQVQKSKSLKLLKNKTKKYRNTKS